MFGEASNVSPKNFAENEDSWTTQNISNLKNSESKKGQKKSNQKNSEGSEKFESENSGRWHLLQRNYLTSYFWEIATTPQQINTLWTKGTVHWEKSERLKTDRTINWECLDQKARHTNHTRTVKLRGEEYVRLLRRPFEASRIREWENLRV